MKDARGLNMRKVGNLTRKQMRTVECKLGVYLDEPVHVFLTSNQQFGVCDEDERLVGFIVASDCYFTETELRKKITKLFT